MWIGEKDPVRFRKICEQMIIPERLNEIRQRIPKLPEDYHDIMNLDI